MSIKPNIEILDADRNLQKRSVDSSGRLKTRGKHAGRVSWQNAQILKALFSATVNMFRPLWMHIVDFVWWFFFVFCILYISLVVDFSVYLNELFFTLILYIIARLFIYFLSFYMLISSMFYYIDRIHSFEFLCVCISYNKMCNVMEI